MDLKTVIFDFDGTLHDSMRIYPAAFRAGYEAAQKQAKP